MHFFFFVLHLLLTLVSAEIGCTWEQTGSSSQYWQKISQSSNGQFIIAGYLKLFRSSDYGATWSESTIPDGSSVNSVAISDDGQYLSYTTFNNLYYSTDSGASFTLFGSCTFCVVTMDTTGLVQNLISRTDIKYTADSWSTSGTSTVTGDGSSLSANSVAGSCSSDGDNQFTIKGYSAGAGGEDEQYIYQSSDSGANYASETTTLSLTFNGASCNSDCSSVIVAANGGIYEVTAEGSSQLLGGFYHSPSQSSDSTVMATGSNTAKTVYVKSPFNTEWEATTPIDSGNAFQAVSVSRNAKVILAAQYGGYIYKCVLPNPITTTTTTATTSSSSTPTPTISSSVTSSTTSLTTSTSTFSTSSLTSTSISTSTTSSTSTSTKTNKVVVFKEIIVEVYSFVSVVTVINA